MMVEMLTREPALQAESLMALMHQIYMRDPARFATDLPAPFDAIVGRCLQKDPADRPTAAELAAML